MALILKQSTAVDVLIGPFVDKTDGATAETGESPTVKLSKNGQALAAKSDVTTPVHDADGYYNCELDATDTNTVGTVVLTVAASANALPVRHEFYVVEEAVYDAMYGASAAGPLQSTTAGRTLDVAATGEAGLDFGNVTGTLSGGELAAGVFGAGAITAAAVATGAIDADALAADAGTEIGTAVWATTTRVLTAGTNLNDLSTADVDARLAAIGLDHLVGASVTGTDVVDNSIVAKLVSSSATADWDSYVNTTDSLQATRDHIGDGTNLTEAGGTGDHLTAINLPNQTMDITGDITGNLSGSVGSVVGHTAQTGDTFALANGAAGFVAIDAVVDAVKAVTDALPDSGALTSIAQASAVATAVELAKVPKSDGTASWNATALGDINTQADTAISDASLATAAALATVDGIVDTLNLGIITGAAGATSLTTTTASSDLTGYADDQLIGRVIIWTSGACDGEATDITDYANTSGVLTFTALTTAPSNGDTFKIV